MTSDELLLPAGQSAYRVSSEPAPDVVPFAECEIRAAALRPDRVLDLVLVERARFARTVAGGHNLLLLIGILLLTSFVAALPFGVVLGPTRALRVAALNLGSVAICFPALHVFGCYFGWRARPAQTLILALLVSAVAGLFALGFAPVVWFIDLTTSSGSRVTGHVAGGLLVFSVLAGVAHLGRAAADGAALAPGRVHRVLMAAWVGLLLFVVHRMGVFLDLL